MSRSVAVFAIALLVLVTGVVRANASPATDTVTVLDTLAFATPSTTFSVFGSGGQSIFSSQFVGPQFTLTHRTRITEIGAFVNNCVSIIDGVPQCPHTLPFIVEVRPSVNGVPDASTVLATFVLSDDQDPLTVSFEAVATHLVLEAGTYFAIFGTQTPADAGDLLSTAPGYQAGLTILGFVDPTGGRAPFASTLFAAVRILGQPLGDH